MKGKFSISNKEIEVALKHINYNALKSLNGKIKK